MSPEDGKVSRRSFVKGATAVSVGALATRGVYQFLEEFGVIRPAPAYAALVTRPQEQYLVTNIGVILDNGVTVAIPPIYNDVITAKLKSGGRWTISTLKTAQIRLENALATVERAYPPTAAGLTVVVGWGLPYFRTYLPAALWQANLPVDQTLSRQAGTTQYGVLDAVDFPSDPADLLLEDNHVMFKFRSDSQAILTSVEVALLTNQSSGAFIGDLFDLTSQRVGFLGRGFGTPSVAKQLALKAGVPQADKIPDNSQLMLGFTWRASDRRAGPGQHRELRNPARRDQPMAKRLLRQRLRHAPVAPVGGPQPLVHQLRLLGPARPDVLPAHPRPGRHRHGHTAQRTRRRLYPRPGQAGRNKGPARP